MRTRLRFLVGAFAVAAFFALVADAGAETCKLEVKKVDPSNRARSPLEYMFQSTYPQRFFMQIGGPEGMIRRASDEEKPKFSEIIKKEPKYIAEHPFRGVAKLGSEYYGFTLDSPRPKEAEENKKEDNEKKDAEPKADAKAKKAPKLVSYSRLYFDLNHNGDLTDDKPVDAATTRQSSPTYGYSSFPRVDIEIDVDGKKMPYAFTLRISTRVSGNLAYANGSLNAAAYREGEITVDGKKVRVVIVDFNSNGIFNDESKINDKIRHADGSVYPTQGDHIFVIDPDATPGRSSPYDVSSNDSLHYVAGLVHLDGKFHDLKITPAGDKVTLSPSSIPVGYVTNPNKGYRAVVYSDKGFLKVVDNEEGKSPLPEGEWKLLSYTIDQTGWNKPEEPNADKKDDAKAEAKAQKNAKAPARRPSGPTLVSARGKRTYKSVKVEKGKTVELPFGPPYQPIVSVQYANQNKREVRLGLSIVGVADEACTDLRVNGRRPGKPKFTISTKDGKEVESGAFEYG